MRRIRSWLFITLDGVVESPEKWVRFNDEIGQAIEAEMQAADALLLGRRTYEVFAASWPQRTAENDPGAPWMNETPKYVVSTTLEAPEWQSTTVIRGDVREGVSQLKEKPGKDISVNGSATLVRSLLPTGLIDELRLFVMPVLAGAGGRFPQGDDEVALELTDSRSFSNGVASLTYRPTQADTRS